MKGINVGDRVANYKRLYKRIVDHNVQENNRLRREKIMTERQAILPKGKKVL